MPIIWRYLLKHILKTFFLSIFVFISVLILMRMQEIARFVTLGTSISTTLLFIIYQFPLILPLAIPISALIATTLLMQRMNTNHELTSLRSQGFGVQEILYPIRLFAISLTLLNFVIVSELTPGTRLKSKNLIYYATAHNPLLLLRMNKVSKIKNSYADLTMIKSGKEAKDLTFAFLNPSTKQLNLIFADRLLVENEGMLIGENVAFISNLSSKKPNGFDHLILENYRSIQNSSFAIASLLHETDIKRQSLQQLRIKPLMIKTLFDSSHGQVSDCLIEVARRCFLAVITFSFTMMGALFSIQIGRIKRKTGLLTIFLLTLVSLTCYLLAKKPSQSMSFTLTLFALPLIAILLANMWKKHRIERGIE